MSIRRPSYTRDEQQALLASIQKEIVFPYTFRLNRLVSSVLFNIPDSGVTGSGYDASIFTAPETLQIIAVRATAVVQLANTSTYAWCLSYAVGFTMADTVLPTVRPDDTGNEIYRTIFRGNGTLDDFFFFDGNKGFYMSKGQQLNFYYWADAAAITAASFQMIGALTLYAKVTGLQS